MCRCPLSALIIQNLDWRITSPSDSLPHACTIRGVNTVDPMLTACWEKCIDGWSFIGCNVGLWDSFVNRYHQVHRLIKVWTVIHQHQWRKMLSVWIQTKVVSIHKSTDDDDVCPQCVGNDKPAKAPNWQIPINGDEKSTSYTPNKTIHRGIEQPHKFKATASFPPIENACVKIRYLHHFNRVYRNIL